MINSSFNNLSLFEKVDNLISQMLLPLKGSVFPGLKKAMRIEEVNVRRFLSVTSQPSEINTVGRQSTHNQNSIANLNQ